jgi:rhamnulokinase
MGRRVFAAVDLGASSGRVVAGVVDGGAVALDVVHRFANRMLEIDGHLRWDFTGLHDEILAGLAALAARYPDVESIGVDTWGVDYGLVDGDGNLLAEPIAYRDQRTKDAVDDVHARVPRDELFAITGLQFIPFNTIYQLAAEQRSPWWEKAAHVALLPDLVALRLTGELRTEATIASTTGLLDVRSGHWSRPLLERLGIPLAMLPPVELPGTVRGRVRSDVCRELGVSPSVVVTTVGSHDTASAVVGVPATTERFAYVSSGTWSLVGLELDAPVLTGAARAANFTNERGVDAKTRFLRNTGGLWLLQESLRTWREQGHDADLAQLLGDAARLPGAGPVVDVDDVAFVAPGEMPARIERAAGCDLATPAHTVRCIVDSLAAAYAAAVEEASAITGREVDVVHVVGGGSRNELLCRATAQLARTPVVAGPAEATALGNVLVQARAHGAAPATLDEMRTDIARHAAVRRYEPS